ncbi:hypothetical protein BS17DRAFT_797839 [Gyrodon lividus]|nr:hypothetical protein BS17DRAFT_797839 [Gyrodon lividus]
MLREKRKRFEDKFQVSETERLLGENWVQSFCNTYKIHHFNMDKTAFNPYALPDRKRKKNFCISIRVACNADGTEKLDLFYVGKAAKPQCLKKKIPEECGFYYRNNKKAWMTSELFEE